MPPPVGHSAALDAYLEYTPRTLPVMTDEHDGITLERIPFEWPELIPPFDLLTKQLPSARFHALRAIMMNEQFGGKKGNET